MFYETSKNNHGLKYNPFKSPLIFFCKSWICVYEKFEYLAKFNEKNYEIIDQWNKLINTDLKIWK